MSSLMTSIAAKGRAPYKQVLTHGFTVDGEGKKMSKSIGNTVAPQHVINKLGADILRLWVASTDYRSEIAVSDEILNRSADSYRRIRNTARFLLSNLNGFDPATDLVPVNEMVELDKWAVGRAAAIQDEIIAAFERYDLLVVTQKMMQFCSIEMGSFYLDIIKDRQYTAKTDSQARRSCQSALYLIAEALVRWMAPIMSFTAQEIWQELPGERNEFVFTETWFTGLTNSRTATEFTNDFWLQVLSVKTAVNKAIELERKESKLGGSLEAEVTLYANDALYKQLASLQDELRFVLITSAAIVKPLSHRPEDAKSTEVEGLSLEIKQSNGQKCVRCWHHREDVGTDPVHPELCNRCIENVDGKGETRVYA